MRSTATAFLLCLLARPLGAADTGPESFKPPPSELLQQVLDGPLADCGEIVFAQRVSGRDHWYGNFGHYCENDSPYSRNAISQEGDMRYAFGDGGRLCRLNLRSGKLQVLLDDPGGGIRDPNVHYDARKILFSYRKSGTKTYHLYEIDIDGSNLRQLTDGPDNDIEPIYTPDGAIIFCSSRCHRFVPCWRTQVATLYRCDADGGNIRMLSNNAEQENTPWMMSDGRILYMRWEYVDRHMMKYHHLWTVNPDGTGVMVYFGNQHPGGLMIDAKPIPGSNKVVASFSPGHGRTEHEGQITIVDPNGGPDKMSMARKISDQYFRDPYPLSDEHFLVADRQGLHLLAADGTTTLIYHPARQGARWDCHEPRPLRSRPREPVVPSRIANQQPTGRLVLSDIYTGRNMEGVARGDIKKLLILEQLPRPANFSNGQEPLTVGGTFMLERILGTVPVEEDGSAFLELPALRSLFFVALDENDQSVKRMQSFVTVQPGETTACVGCHEQRVHAPPSPMNTSLAALRHPPHRPAPFSGIPDVLDFPRDIQPILDRHCVACHNADRRDGQVDLSGDRTPYFTAAYWTMFTNSLVVDGRNSEGNRPPYSIGSSASRLMRLIDGSHHGAKLSDPEQTVVRLWIESGAVYPGTYGALGSGVHTVQFPERIIERRCAACHQRTDPPYRNPKAGAINYQFGKREPQHPLMSDPYDIILIRHLAYFQLGEAPLHQALCNLDQPQKSLLLQAPLGAAAGGKQLCGAAVFKDASDPDYQEMLAAIQDASDRLSTEKRFDMPGFRPNRYYIREMQNFGVLPRDLPKDSTIDTYATDREYWRQAYWKYVSRDSKSESLYRVTSPPVELELDPFYTKYVSVRGYPIVAAAEVNDYALKEAAYLVDTMTAKRPDVLQAMIASGSRMCVLGYNQYTTDLPEFSHFRPKDYWDARARGTGGSRTDPYCSCGEENLLGYPGDPYAAECILIHEFAHNIHLRGLVRIDPSFDDRLKKTYQIAMERGLWRGKYAAVNHHEYFAEGVQSWFDNNRPPDHDHNHVDTRKELIEYDPGLADICREVFGDTEIRYTKPATRLRGHMAGYDPSAAPKFSWPERLKQAQEEIRREVQRRIQEQNAE